MIQQVGPTHCLNPIYWEEWAKETEITGEQYYRLMMYTINADKNRGFKTVFDLHPDNLRTDYVSVYRAAARELEMQGASK